MGVRGMGENALDGVREIWDSGRSHLMHRMEGWLNILPTSLYITR